MLSKVGDRKNPMSERTIINASIDVTKIDKAYFREGKNGQKYLDVVLIGTPDGKYGNDFMVSQSLPKAERAAGKKGAILGNGKYFRRGTDSTPQSAPATQPAVDDDSVPF